jgi:hypothetical protein
MTNTSGTKDKASASDPVPPKCSVIEVHVGELKQLFNAIDPSPFRDKDLDPKAEEFIVGWAKELPRDATRARSYTKVLSFTLDYGMRRGLLLRTPAISININEPSIGGSQPQAQLPRKLVTGRRSDQLGYVPANMNQQRTAENVRIGTRKHLHAKGMDKSASF